MLDHLLRHIEFLDGAIAACDRHVERMVASFGIDKALAHRAAGGRSRPGSTRFPASRAGRLR
jgi:hypothetical protein